MKCLSPVGEVYQAGTMSGNPIVMAAGLTTLKKIKNNKEEYYLKIEELGRQLEEGVIEIAKDKGISVTVNRYGGMMTIFFTDLEVVKTYEDVKTCDEDLFKKYLKHMIKSGINIPSSQYEALFLSVAHTIEKTIKEYDYSFNKIILGEALIGNRSDEESYNCNLICDAIKENINEKDNILLIGHGSKTINYNVYNCIKNNLKEKGYKNTYIGTLEGEVKKEDIVKSLVEDNVKDVTIIPILMLPGNHIKKDIFGSENSWKSLFENEGILVKYVEKSLLQYSEIRKYYMNKIERHLFQR